MMGFFNVRFARGLFPDGSSWSIKMCGRYVFLPPSSMNIVRLMLRERACIYVLNVGRQIQLL